MPWSSKYENCLSCGTTKRKHIAKGLCTTCYYKSIEDKHKNPVLKRGTVSKKLDNAVLEMLYIQQSKSISDIAKILSCSRQFINKKMKEYNIEGRSKTDARKLALDSGKIFFDRKMSNGETERIYISKHKVNENFFSSWSDKMAYVLGVIYTDGNICHTQAPHAKKSYLRLSVAQKEPELLEKVLLLMDSNHTIKKRIVKEGFKSNEIHYFDIQNEILCSGLIKLGVTPKKSLTVKFPNIPEPFIRHFIRGCWDGDGSISKASDSNSYRASFVSGSYDFIFYLVNYLKDKGFDVKPSKTEMKNTIYYFKIDGNEQCSRLFHYLYDDVSPEMYLERKYKKFLESAELYSNSQRLKPYKRPEYIK
jgi:hypothetical protein